MFFVATGTAANVLAIASLTEVWEQVVCHQFSHYHEDESTGPERIAHCRAVQVRPPDGSSKITIDQFRAVGTLGRGDVHQPQPGVLTVSNSTEMGEVYSPAEMAELCAAGWNGFGDGPAVIYRWYESCGIAPGPLLFRSGALPGQ